MLEKRIVETREEREIIRYKNQRGERKWMEKEREREIASKRSPFDFLGQESRLLGTPAPRRSS